VIYLYLPSIDLPSFSATLTPKSSIVDAHLSISTVYSEAKNSLNQNSDNINGKSPKRLSEIVSPFTPRGRPSILHSQPRKIGLAVPNDMTWRRETILLSSCP
jgi:hypothetical protein